MAPRSSKSWSTTAAASPARSPQPSPHHRCSVGVHGAEWTWPSLVMILSGHMEATTPLGARAGVGLFEVVMYSLAVRPG
ncbi:hypothetical protein SAVERM_533 [Streptomyces avermitilis MA-4680 = NBRC 14893]|uniref:Uncharacterized protein n=1 Tax=Streptomyces avermitilis (strain ATCC 31267 / DSM 46492 / JCM 5070 / NBRC 14893 / NCIMB 12804 / NRRL 8165 / MA-4680) TaxID=227882 RepID=Q82QH3_STRAW|nr:hypothetical protein SAVERM_533 [Streptomyces avermitilis MA-4680 = NBRC 14893]